MGKDGKGSGSESDQVGETDKFEKGERNNMWIRFFLCLCLLVWLVVLFGLPSLEKLAPDLPIVTDPTFLDAIRMGCNFLCVCLGTHVPKRTCNGILSKCICFPMPSHMLWRDGFACVWQTNFDC